VLHNNGNARLIVGEGQTLSPRPLSAVPNSGKA
jgi:hypothetical protein